MTVRAEALQTESGASCYELVKTPGNPSSAKEAYREFCSHEKSLHLFARDWWLDAAVGPSGWDVALVRKRGVILAAMPYVRRRRFGMRVLTQPALTPVLGPWFRTAGGKQAAQLGSDNELMQALIDQLPPFDHFSQTWHPSISNWQPFYWNGFRQTTYYTFVLPDLSNIDALWTGLDSKVRRSIVKAETEFGLRIRDDLPLDTILSLNHKTFARQGLSPPYSDEFVRRIDAACLERGCRMLLAAVDEQGVTHAAYYFVWDEHSAYGLISSTDPAYRRTNGNSFCLWVTIQRAARVTRQYNFAGSMIQPIENYLRGFGGKHVPYFHLTKTPSLLLRVRQELNLFKGKS
jgi:hypothetical protein